MFRTVSNPKKIFCQITGYHPQDILSINTILGGMSNQIFLVTTYDKRFTLRLPFKESGKYVDYFIESKVLGLLASTDISNRVLYFNEVTGIRISEYTDGQVLSDPDIVIDDYIPKIASRLHELHSLEYSIPYKYEFDLILTKYESLTNNIDPRYFTLKQLWMNKFYTNFFNDLRVFSHGDIQRSNIIVNSSRTQVYLLDFEFSRFNYVHFDLASFGNIDFNDSLKLTYEYFKNKPNVDADIYKVKFFRMFQVLQWYLVALSKDKTKIGSFLKLNFLEVANNYLNQAINFSVELELSDH
ncbi:MAG: phosphotransferase [Acholeplasmatales bacterium]|jgi:thiamine kinase-like enzyme|nr:phosphotransferase [Acholeplasmatales bacterium]